MGGYWLGCELVAKKGDGWIGWELAVRKGDGRLGWELVAKKGDGWLGWEPVAKRGNWWLGWMLVAKKGDGWLSWGLVAKLVHKLEVRRLATLISNSYTLSKINNCATLRKVSLVHLGRRTLSVINLTVNISSRFVSLRPEKNTS